VLQLIGLIPIDAAAVPQNGSATVSLSTAPSTLLAPQTQLQFSSQPASVYTIASIDADTLTLTLTGNFTGPSGATGMVIFGQTVAGHSLGDANMTTGSTSVTIASLSGAVVITPSPAGDVGLQFASRPGVTFPLASALSGSGGASASATLATPFDGPSGLTAVVVPGLTP
jgi:hypothetical protein